MVDLEEDRRALAAASLLSRAKVLDAGRAALVVGSSRGTVERWRKADPPLPHDSRPGHRPAYLFSEYDVVAFALTAEPQWRAAALARIQDATPTSDLRGDTESAQDVAEIANPVNGDHPPQAGEAAPDGQAVIRERDRLRAENDRLVEQMERVLRMLNEESKSRRRQVKEFIATIRAANIPGNTQPLDDLLGGG